MCVSFLSLEDLPSHYIKLYTEGIIARPGPVRNYPLTKRGWNTILRRCVGAAQQEGVFRVLVAMYIIVLKKSEVGTVPVSAGGKVGHCEVK